MRSTHRSAAWLFLITLACLALMSCQFSQSILVQASPTPPPTNTPLPAPTDTPTQPPPPTETPTQPPPPTETATTIPSPTVPPPPTEIPATDTPALAEVTVINNLNSNVKISLSGPANKTFSVQKHGTYTFETPPGQYTYRFEAQGFYPETNYVSFVPGPNSWTFGKAKP